MTDRRGDEQAFAGVAVIAFPVGLVRLAVVDRLAGTPEGAEPDLAVGGRT